MRKKKNSPFVADAINFYYEKYMQNLKTEKATHDLT